MYSLFLFHSSSSLSLSWFLSSSLFVCECEEEFAKMEVNWRKKCDYRNKNKEEVSVVITYTKH